MSKRKKGPVKVPSKPKPTDQAAKTKQLCVRRPQSVSLSPQGPAGAVLAILSGLASTIGQLLLPPHVAAKLKTDIQKQVL